MLVVYYFLKPYWCTHHHQHPSFLQLQTCLKIGPHTVPYLLHGSVICYQPVRPSINSLQRQIFLRIHTQPLGSPLFNKIHAVVRITTHVTVQKHQPSFLVSTFHIHGKTVSLQNLKICHLLMVIKCKYLTISFTPHVSVQCLQNLVDVHLSWVVPVLFVCLIG